MKSTAANLASAALTAVLVGTGPAWAHHMRSGAHMSSMGSGRSVAIDREHRWHNGWQWRHHRNWGWRSGLAWRRYPYNLDNYAYNYGYPYNYAYGYGYPSVYAYGYGYPSVYAYGYGYPYNYGYAYGYPSSYAYDYINPFAIVTAPTAAATALATPVAAAAAAPLDLTASATAPLVTGRSVATGQTGKMCSTPVKACELIYPSYIGNGCSCRVASGRLRGTVSP